MPRKNADTQRKQAEQVRTDEVADRVRVARGHLERDEVSTARRSLDAIAVTARQDPAVISVRDDVTRREERRDGALNRARRCLQTSDWACALREAKAALAIDRTSDEARQIAEKVANLGLVPPATPEKPRVSRPRVPGSATPAPPRSLEGGTAIDPARSECEATVAAGRRALARGRYDEAIASANGALGALGLCPGAEELEQDAIRAKGAARN